MLLMLMMAILLSPCLGVRLKIKHLQRPMKHQSDDWSNLVQSDLYFTLGIRYYVGIR